MAHLCAFVFAKVGSRGLMQRRASFSSSLVPTEIQDLVASAECTNPKRDRLVESHLSKNERWAIRPGAASC